MEDGGTNRVRLTSRCQEETVSKTAKLLVEHICQGLVNGMGSNGQPFGNGMAPTFEVALLQLINDELQNIFGNPRNPNGQDRLRDAMIDGISGSLSKVNGSTMLLYTMIHGPNVGKFKDLLRVVFMIAANDMKTMQKSNTTMGTFIDKVIHLLFSQDAVLHALVPSRPNPTQRGGQGTLRKHRNQRKKKQRRRATRKYVGGVTDDEKLHDYELARCIYNQDFRDNQMRDTPYKEVVNVGGLERLQENDLQTLKQRCYKYTKQLYTKDNLARIASEALLNKRMFVKDVKDFKTKITDDLKAKGKAVANSQLFNSETAKQEFDAHIANRNANLDTRNKYYDEIDAVRHDNKVAHDAELATRYEKSFFKPLAGTMNIASRSGRRLKNATLKTYRMAKNAPSDIAHSLYVQGHTMGDVVRNATPITSTKNFAKSAWNKTRKLFRGSKNEEAGETGETSEVGQDQVSGQVSGQGTDQETGPDIQEAVNEYGTTLIQKLTTRLQSMEVRLADRIMDAMGELLGPGKDGATKIVLTISEILGQSMGRSMAQFGDITMYSLLCTMMHNEQSTLGDAIETSYAKFGEEQSKQKNKGDASISAFIAALQTDAILDIFVGKFSDTLSAELFPPSN